MIDPPSIPTGQAERRTELDRVVDFAIQLLVEEAHLVGWQRIEFLTAIIDTANSRLAAAGEEIQHEMNHPSKMSGAD